MRSITDNYTSIYDYLTESDSIDEYRLAQRLSMMYESLSQGLEVSEWSLNQIIAAVKTHDQPIPSCANPLTRMASQSRVCDLCGLTRREYEFTYPNTCPHSYCQYCVRSRDRKSCATCGAIIESYTYLRRCDDEYTLSNWRWGVNFDSAHDDQKIEYAPKYNYPLDPADIPEPRSE